MDNSQFGYLLPGKWYELALFTYTLINNQKKVFDLGKEIHFGGKWDDLVIKVCENSYKLFTFFQIKLVDNSDNTDMFINSEVLMGKRKISLKESDFKLQKYFISYLRIKDQLKSRNDKSKIQKLIVFTNANLNVNELQKNVGNILCCKTNKNDVIPNTDKDSRFYKIFNVRNTFTREIKKNIKLDFEFLAEELASYVINTKVNPMTLEKDCLAYYHTSLIDENVIDLKTKRKRAVFSESFIDGQGLSIRAQKLRNRVIEMVKKNGYDLKTLQAKMKAVEWTISEDFDFRKTDDEIFLPNYKITDKDVKDFFDVLEFRVSQLAVKELLNRIKNVEIKDTFLEYYDTDPKLVEFLINDFIQTWRIKKTTAEKWVLNNEKSMFITELKSKISKPSVIYKTQNHVNYLKAIIEKFGLVYFNNFLFNNNNISIDTFNIIKTSSVILTSAKMVSYLDTLKPKDYVFVNIDILLPQKEIMKLTDALEHNDFNFVVLSCKILGNNRIINNFFSKLFQLPKKTKGKKIIIITELIESSVLKICKDINGIKEYVDNSIFLQHLKDTSKMLQQKIIIRDHVLEFGDFVSEAQYNMVDTDILEHFIYHGGLKIGSNLLHTSYLEGAYTELFEEIKVEALVHELLSQESDDIFVISCVSRTGAVKNLVRSLKAGMINSNVRLNIDCIRNKIGSLNQQEISNNIDKRVQVTDYQFTDKDFKKMCHIIVNKKIYWIQLKQEDKFILLQIYNPDFYLKGNRFNTEVVIGKDIKKELASNNLSEIYIVSGKNKNEFESWLQLSNDQMLFQENCKSNKIKILPSRENEEITFREMVQLNLGHTIHLLSFIQDHLTWCKTHGSVKKLCEYRAEGYRNTKLLMNEDDLIQEIKDKKAIIIAGDPGMGKSTSLIKLYELPYVLQSGVEESVIKSHWLIRVNLKDHLKILPVIDSENTKISSVCEQIAKFLLQVDENSNNNFEAFFLVMALLKDSFKIPILVVFDGFDEVIDESDRNKVQMLLKYLNNKTKTKIWITTRHHYESTLEKALLTFAIKIERIGTSKIREFIKAYLKNNLSLIINREQYEGIFSSSGNMRTNSKLDKFIKLFLQKMQEIFKGDVSKFIGSPLQLYLMLENSSRHFKENLTSDVGETLDLSYLGCDLWTTYESFINRKYEIYFRKTESKVNLKKEQDKFFFDHYHRSLSKALLNIAPMNKSYNQFRDVILSVGIVRSFKGEIEFIHPTFTEYFIAKEFMSWIYKWKRKNVCKITNFEKQKFLLQDILVRIDYKVVRIFLNAVLLKENHKTFLIKPQFYDKTILFVACNENNVEIARLIFNNVPEADINPRDQYQSTALEKAAASGNLEMVQFLIERDSSILDDHDGQSVLHYAVSSNNLKLVEYLIDNGADFNHKDIIGRPVLQMDTSFEIFQYLIERGADVNAKVDAIGLTILQSAVNSNHFDKVKYLIEKGAKVDVKDRTNDLTILHSAAASENLEMVKILIDHGANVETKDSIGRTVLHWSAEFGNLEVFEYLMKKNVDVNALDEQGRTVLHYAARSEKLDIVKFLVEKLNMDVNITDRSGRTGLHYAVESGNLKIVKFVLKYVKDVNFKDESGRTALHDASASGYNDIIAVLLNQNADVTLKDKKGKTALDLAKQWMQETSIVLLQQRENEVKV